MALVAHERLVCVCYAIERFVGRQTLLSQPSMSNRPCVLYQQFSARTFSELQTVALNGLAAVLPYLYKPIA